MSMSHEAESSDQCAYLLLCSVFLSMCELLVIAMFIVYASFVHLLTDMYMVSDLLFDMSVITGHQYILEYSYSHNELGRSMLLLCFHRVILYR
jgi:hypothetical protein